MKRVLGMLSCLLLLGAALGTAVAQQGGGPGGTGLPTEETDLFAGSGICARCHEGLLENRVDVSPVTLWRASMMGNSAKDPVWLAKVSAEGAELPDLAAAIEDKCITCHSPMLHYEVVPASLAALIGYPLYRDGINCTVCHQIQPTNFGLYESFSGGFQIDDTRRIFGPYPNPLAGPMVNDSRYWPREAYQGSGTDWVINDSEHCATCHNLFTNYKIGEYPDGTTILSTEKFPEQTPYYEWLNSDYPGLGTTCQGCHMPSTVTPIAISTRPRRLQTRSPFWYHEFVGGNTFMLGMLRDNVADLGLTATAAQFGEKIIDTQDLLLADTAGLAASGSISGETLTVDVTVTNKAGHKLPTGIPLRRVWIHLTVSAGGSVLFESGGVDSDGEIVGLDAGYEPHYEVIHTGDEVQIYQGVMQTDPRADPDGLTYVTRTLLLAGDYAKDNRLPPAGFSTNSSLYEYTEIVGGAASDDDFNADGSGQDTVTYEIAVGAAEEPFTVAVEVLYQSVTPGEATYLAGYATPEAQDFSALYNEADNTPAILAATSFDLPVPEP
ncbi:MAG: multiheme c-type cytochrome [Deferrisomatales bacterium]|nr:multiheme c-type cytochrome [Deferrisomatales bacterium]